MGGIYQLGPGHRDLRSTPDESVPLSFSKMIIKKYLAGKILHPFFSFSLEFALLPTRMVETWRHSYQENCCSREKVKLLYSCMAILALLHSCFVTFLHSCLGKLLHSGLEILVQTCCGRLEYSCLGTCLLTVSHCCLATVEHCCLGTLLQACLGILPHLSSWTLLGTCRLCSLGTDWHRCLGTDRHSCLWTLNLSWNWTAQLLWHRLYCLHGHEHVIEFPDPCNVSIDLDNPLHSSLFSKASV